MTTTTVTTIQRDALPIIDQDPLAIGIAAVTLLALERKGLIRDLSNGNRVRWALTGSGELLCGEITAPAPTAPRIDSDPFAAFDQFNEGS